MSATKFSQDVIPISDLKVNPGRIVKQITESHRPVLMTSRGRGVAVIQALSDYEQAAEELEFARAVVRGIADLEAGHEINLAEAKKRLNINNK